MKQQQGFQLKAFGPMSILSPIETLLETYDQPFFKKPALSSSNLLLQQQLADWVHQIYFDQKKLNELSVLRLIEHPLEAIKPNIKCSIMYGIIRQKVQHVCKQIRQLIMDSYRKLNTKKQTNSDLKHNSDSWNVNFSKFRKANIQTGMNKVYGPIAHIICTYHNSLLDCNTEVYSLWKILYQCSEMKDLEFKTLQGSLNELILDQLMQDYPNNEMIPKDIMPTLSSFEKHQFIFKEMWGFQKRKLAVQFHAKSQESLQSDKERQNQLMSSQNMPKKVQKGQILSPPKPIPLSLKQFGVNTSQSQKIIKFKELSERQMAKRKAMEEEIQFMQLQQQFADMDLQTRNKILQHLYDFRRAPISDKRKKQSLKTIEKILNHENDYDDEKLAIIGSEQMENLPDENIDMEIDEDDQDTESDQDNNHYFYEDDNQIDQENENEDILVRMKLRQNKQLQQFRNFNRQWRAKRLLDTRQQQNRARQTGQRYIKLCQRLDNIRKTYKAAGIEFKDPEIQKALDRSAAQTKLIDQILDIQEALPELIHIKKSQSLENDNAQKPLPKVQQKQPLKPEPSCFKFLPQTDKQNGKAKTTQRPLKIQSSAYSLKLDQETQAMKKQSLYQKLKRYYQTNTYEEFYCDDEFRQEKRAKNQNINKKQNQSEIFFGKNVPMSAFTDLISDKDKSITFSSNTKLSSKLQKISRQQILDQIYEVAKEKQKREKKGQKIKNDIKLAYTYKRISYEVRNGDDKNQIRITKGQLTTDDFNWYDDFSDKAKYHLTETSEYGEKLIDEPNEDLCQDEKPQKKKKKKKKKKNKQKKELSEDNENNLEKGSNSSLNDEEEDLESLQEFKKKSISDLFNLRKMMGWPEEQTLHEYLESSERLQREKEQELLMEKKIEIYEKNGQQEKNNERDRKAASKENKNRRENYTEEEIKLFQFLQSLEIKEENRDKCVVSEQTLQKIILKRKQIKSLQIFEKANQRAEQIGPSANKNEKEKQSEAMNEETPKVPKPRNKKKKK